jgi:hypothetical protein
MCGHLKSYRMANQELQSFVGILTVMRTTRATSTYGIPVPSVGGRVRGRD